MKPFVPSWMYYAYTRQFFSISIAGIESLENRRHYAREKLLRRANNQESATLSDDVLFP